MAERPTVLVVEDERDLADLYETWLADDYDVRVALTGEDAVDLLDGDVDVALVDRRLPDRHGDEVLADIGADYPGVRVGMVSGVEPGFNIIDLGFDAYVVKPVSRDDLRDLVERLLARAAYTREMREFFSLASKRATLEAEKTDAELAESDAYSDLVARLETRRESLDDLLANLTTDDYVAVFRELDDELDG